LVLNDDKRTLVLAGAGSGKTKTLLQKLNYLISEKKVKASNILTVTFTKNAANEMIDRLIFDADSTGEYEKIIYNKKNDYKTKENKRFEFKNKFKWIDRLTIRTFHSICYKI
jgi:DNA helicase IV